MLKIVPLRGLRNGFNPEMLEIAMDLRAVDAAKLCNTVRITQQKLQDFFAYRNTPTPKELESIANLLRFPTAFFRREGEYIKEGIHVWCNPDYADEEEPAPPQKSIPTHQQQPLWESDHASK